MRRSFFLSLAILVVLLLSMPSSLLANEQNGYYKQSPSVSLAHRMHVLLGHNSLALQNEEALLNATPAPVVTIIEQPQHESPARLHTIAQIATRGSTSFYGQ